MVNTLAEGGAARAASNLTCAWAEAGRQVTILTTDDGREPSLYPLHPGVTHRPLALAGSSRHPLEAVVRNGWRLLKLRRAILESRPDLLISFLDGNNVMCLIATRGCRRIPTIISERTDPHGRPLGSAWERLRHLTYPWADCLVVQTAHALSYFPARVRAKGVVIPNPVILPKGRAGVDDPLPARTRYSLITLGRLDKVKGHDMLIEAFASIAPAFPDWDLRIYGDGPERQTLDKQINAHSLAQRILLPGNTADAALRLREADLFVLPSRVEGFPNALAEAMAAGLPVISFDCRSGPSELIRPGIDGVLVPPNDLPALSTAMARMMADPAERARLAASAPEVLERFSVERVLALWETAIRRVGVR